MSDEPKPASERARKRAAGKILREALIKRREVYFDLLVSGYSVEQIASHTKKSPSAVRRAIGQALGKRQLDAPEDYARSPSRAADQGAALRRQLRWRKGDVKAIAPFLKVVRELNLYHGVNVGSARPAPAALPEIAPTSPPLALTHSPGVAVTEEFEDEKSCAKAQLSL